MSLQELSPMLITLQYLLEAQGEKKEQENKLKG